MRKKIYGIACLLLFAVVMLTGCGHQSVEQTWYSDRDDQSTLTLKDGQYTDSGWLTTGQYTTKENTITLTSAVDGTHELQIQKDNNGIQCFSLTMDSIHILIILMQMQLSSQEKIG